MKIGLIDADLMWGKHANGRRYGKTKADIFPNLAIMKLSAWHKQQGDDVEWAFPFEHYDVVYMSKGSRYRAEDGEWYEADEDAMIVVRCGAGEQMMTQAEYERIKQKEL